MSVLMEWNADNTMIYNILRYEVNDNDHKSKMYIIDE